MINKVAIGGIYDSDGKDQNFASNLQTLNLLAQPLIVIVDFYATRFIVRMWAVLCP